MDVLRTHSEGLAQLPCSRDCIAMDKVTGVLFFVLTIAVTACPAYTQTLTAAVGQVGYVTSPNYPYNYPNSTDCKWLLVTNTYYTVVKVTILDLALQTCSQCSCDYLQLYDGPQRYSPSLGKVCNPSQQTVFYSSGQNVYIRFYSDSSITNYGFQLSYEAVYSSDVPMTTRLPLTTTTYNASACPAYTQTLTAAVGQVGYVTSPNYPYNYANYADCKWLLVTNSYYTVVKVTILDVLLETCSQCSCDYVQLYDGPSQYYASLGNVCNPSQQTVFYSSGQNLYIHFYSDSSITNYGFQLRYEAVDSSDVPMTTSIPLTTTDYSSSVCSGDVQTLFAVAGHVGYVKSPYYPNNYNNGADCRWRVNSGSYDRVVKVTLESVSMEECSSCCDYVQMFDGMSQSDTRLIKFCSMPGQTVYYSSGQYVYIRFTSDSSGTSSGFSLTYEAVDGQDMPNSGGYRYQYESHTVAAVVGGVLRTDFLVVVIILIYIVRCRGRRQRPAHTYLYNSGSATTNTAYLNNHPTAPPAYSSVYLVGAPPAYPGTVMSPPLVGITNMAYFPGDPVVPGAAGLSVTQQEAEAKLPTQPSEDNAPPVYSNIEEFSLSQACQANPENDCRH